MTPTFMSFMDLLQCSDGNRYDPGVEVHIHRLSTVHIGIAMCCGCPSNLGVYNMPDPVF